MKLYKYTIKALAVLFIVLVGIACEEDFGEVGTGIVGEVNFETNVTDLIDVVSYSQNFPEGVQTNGLPASAFGVYDDAVYGLTTTSVLTQVELSRTDPDFGDNTVIDSVYLTLPYFSTLIDVDADENNTYELDSIFRNTGPMKLSVYRSNYFVNDLDPDSDFEDLAIYYSNDIDNFSGVEGDLLLEIPEFTPSEKAIVLIDTVITERVGSNPPVNDTVVNIDRQSPALRVALDTTYFRQNILDREGSSVLLNGNNFNEYFRGLYFVAEPIDGKGSYVLSSFENARIEIYYRFEGEDDSNDQDTGGTSIDNRGSLRLNFNGVRILDIENEFSGNTPIGNPAFNDTQDRADGEENIYLKGGNGSIGLVSFFGRDNDDDGVADQLEILRDCGIIINEANLILNVDQDAITNGTGVAEPERIFVYDFDNNRVLLDGEFDSSTGNFGPVDTRVNHLGRLTRTIENDLTSPGVSYKIRLTQHINNIINNDSTDVRLALSVSQNVTTRNSSLIGGLEDEDGANRLPVSGVLSPEGTILHGNLSSNEDKRLKLRLYYTLPDGEEGLSAACKRILDIE